MTSHQKLLFLFHYSPLAGAGAVFERTNQSSIIEFGVTDRVHQNDLLLMDKKNKITFYPLAHKMIEGELSGASFSFTHLRSCPGMILK